AGRGGVLPYYINSATRAFFAHQLHGSSKDDEYRPSDSDKSFGENTHLSQQKQCAECDDNHRQHRVVHTPALFPLYSISFHDKNKLEKLN
ncbi:MAG: hypothetical protein WAP52_01700, partial [Candidatus Sungiibacteriota bacterium]